MKHHMCYSILLSLCLLTACAGGGGSSDNAVSSAVDQASLSASAPLAQPPADLETDFAITVCTHPEWIAHPLGGRLDDVLAQAVAILESPPVPDTMPDTVPPHAFDLLTLILHELLHVKGIARAHLDDDEHGIMTAWMEPGEAGRQRTLTDADWALLASFDIIYELIHVGLHADCDVPIGFQDLTGSKLGATFRSDVPVLVWIDSETLWHLP